MKYCNFRIYFIILVFLYPFFLKAEYSEVIELKNFINDKKNYNVTFVIVSDNKSIYYNKEKAEKETIPASVCKIYNSLIALDYGIIKDENEIFYKYNKEEVFLESWKEDTNLINGMKNSNLLAYQQLALKVGIKNMQEGLNRLNFGNKLINNHLDTFWIDDTLKIKPKDLAYINLKLGKSELPFSKYSQTTVKKVMIKDKFKGCNIYSKTGWAVEEKIPTGWIAGFIEKGINIYGFALNMDILTMEETVKRKEYLLKMLDYIKICY